MKIYIDFSIFEIYSASLSETDFGPVRMNPRDFRFSLELKNTTSNRNYFENWMNKIYSNNVHKKDVIREIIIEKENYYTLNGCLIRNIGFDNNIINIDIIYDYFYISDTIPWQLIRLMREKKLERILKIN